MTKIIVILLIATICQLSAMAEEEKVCIRNFLTRLLFTYVE